MSDDRLRNDNKVIHNLKDLIEARAAMTSHIAADVDSLVSDILIPDDVDVNEALTFPHPKRQPKPASMPTVEDLDEDWDAQDILPSDYSHNYDEAIDAHNEDEPDALAQEIIHQLGVISSEEIVSEQEIEIMPEQFAPEKWQ